jgi:hypothetical protein
MYLLLQWDRVGCAKRKRRGERQTGKEREGRRGGECERGGEESVCVRQRQGDREGETPHGACGGGGGRVFPSFFCVHLLFPIARATHCSVVQNSPSSPFIPSNPFSLPLFLSPPFLSVRGCVSVCACALHY